MSSILSSIDASVEMAFAEALTRFVLAGLVASLVVVFVGVLALPARPLVRRLTATLRFRLLAVAFVGAAALPLFTLISGRPMSVARAAASTRSDALIHLAPGAAILIALLWIVLSLVFAGHLLTQAWRQGTLARGAQPVRAMNASVRTAMVDALPCPVALSEGVNSPCVAGVLRPVILLPRHLPDQLTPTQLASVLAHESAHLERRDHWMNLVQKLALVIFPLHPGLHLLDRWLCGERELACDEFVLRHAHAPIDYAASLVDVAAFTLNRPAISLPFGAMRSPSELSARVERILRPAPRLHPVLTVVFTAALTAGTAVLTGFALDRLPTISFEPTHPETLTVPPRSLRLAEDRDDAAAGPIRMVDAAYRAPLVSSTTHPSVSHPRRLSSVAQRFAVSSATAAGAQAYLTAWHRSADGEYGVKPMHAVQPRTRQGQTAAVEYSVVVLFTSVTSSTEVSEPEAQMPQTLSAMQTVEMAHPQRGVTTQVFFSIVTTTLRVRPAERLRLSPEWLERQL